MKKFIAIVLTLVMTFSVAVIPAYALDQVDAVDKAEEIVADVQAGDLYSAIENIYELVIEIIDAIHSIVGTVTGMAGQECPFCEEIHVLSAEEEVEPELPETVVLA